MYEAGRGRLGERLEPSFLRNTWVGSKKRKPAWDEQSPGSCAHDEATGRFRETLENLRRLRRPRCVRLF